MAARVQSDAIVAVDMRQTTLAVAGPFAGSWPLGGVVVLAPATVASEDGVTRVGEDTFRILTVPLRVDDQQIGSLYLATRLDVHLAQELDSLSRARIAIVSGGRLLATTLSQGASSNYQASPAMTMARGVVTLNGESFAFQRVVQLTDASYYALSSIDEPLSQAMSPILTTFILMGIGAGLLAFVVSFSLARSLSKPIGHLSAALAHMAETHHVEGRLALTGSSRELDTLTQTFNELMASIAEAEAQTQAAYTGAIRALAAALDARDPYTAGHSERVSVLSVAIGRQLRLGDEAMEVLRLGALLHDIGKIGVPDEVLRKPGALTAAEYDAIKQHPVLGALILRSVPFLAQHMQIVELHHERPDGKGYPYGLRGDDIPHRRAHRSRRRRLRRDDQCARVSRRPSFGRCAARAVALRRHRIPRRDRRGARDRPSQPGDGVAGRRLRKRRRVTAMRRIGVVVMLLIAARPLAAQSLARFSLDSVVAVDLFRGEATVDRPNIVVDVTGVVRLADGWRLYVRPWFRQPRTAEWDKEIYQAAVQYERSGPVSTRVDAGYIVSPIGLGMMDTRPGVNPTIAPHLSYVTPMPVFDPTAPRARPIASTYPLGAQVTVSTVRWDVRGAVVSTAPTRPYVINGDANPRATPVFVAGGGVTPTTGFRLGLSMAHGDHATSKELTTSAFGDSRTSTMLALEGEYAFGYTRIAGELLHNRLQSYEGAETAYAWFLQGMQTLAPRMFVAARQEGTSAPPLRTQVAPRGRTTFQTSEVTFGYRIIPDLTARGSYMARKPFTRTTWDHQAGVSLVWARRWW